MIKTAVDALLALYDFHDFSDREGFCPTLLNSVRLFRVTDYQQMTPLIYEQGVVIILQGSKLGYVNDTRLEYNQGQYLIVTAPFPICCETFASREKPLMGLVIRMEQALISPLVNAVALHQDESFFDMSHEILGVDVAEVTDGLLARVTRLLSVLRVEMDAAIMGPHILSEMFYDMLLGEQRHILAAFARKDSPLARINRVMIHLHENPHASASVQSMADMAGMSVSVFHRSFKRCVDETPLQYLKKVRLNKAKSLMVHNGLSAGSAALEVGYESVSQFSREFKRYFGLPPSQASRIGYKVFGA